MAHSPARDGARGALGLAAVLGIGVLTGTAPALAEPEAATLSEAGARPDPIPTALAIPETARTLSFSRRGELVASRDLAWLAGAVPPSPIPVDEPYEERIVSFLALSLERVLDTVYGESWREEEELLFTCSDGYQPTVPVARVLAHEAWIAFQRTDQESFSIDKLESGERKRIELAPYYLIWENLSDEQVRQEADYGWPYQLVGIDLIRSADRFPRLVPPDGASPQTHAGFAAFRVHCNKCHKLNGQGGSIGPELNAAAKPVEYRDPAWLRSWIDDPSSILPGTRMPPLNPELPDRERTIDEILAYLRTMAARASALSPAEPTLAP